MKARSKVWLESHGEQCFGAGKAKILRTIDRTGSISAAARTLNMSYRHVWSSLQAAEKRIGKPLLVRRKGGRQRGGTTLTPYARNLLRQFDRLDNDIRKTTDKRFRDIFKP